MRLINKVAVKRYPAGTHTLTFAPKNTVANAIYTVEMRTSDDLGAKRLVRVEYGRTQRFVTSRGVAPAKAAVATRMLCATGRNGRQFLTRYL